jgi:hypothetical protein
VLLNIACLESGSGLIVALSRLVRRRIADYSVPERVLMRELLVSNETLGFRYRFVAVEISAACEIVSSARLPSEVKSAVYCLFESGASKCSSKIAQGQ